jgi:hypothetical protein
MNHRIFYSVAASVLAVALAGCASSSITQLAKNQAVISTSAAPICRTTGAATVANQVAAIATIKQGYSRFVVVGFDTADNTRVIATGPTTATTSGRFNRFGNTVYGSTNTTFGGQMVRVTGRNEAQMQIIMLNPGDAGYDEGLDAKVTLGPEWQKKVEDGIPSCL